MCPRVVATRKGFSDGGSNECETWNFFGLESKDISHTPVGIPGGWCRLSVGTISGHPRKFCRVMGSSQKAPPCVGRGRDHEGNFLMLSTPHTKFTRWPTKRRHLSLITMMNESWQGPVNGVRVSPIKGIPIETREINVLLSNCRRQSQIQTTNLGPPMGHRWVGTCHVGTELPYTAGLVQSGSGQPWPSPQAYFA